MLLGSILLIGTLLAIVLLSKIGLMPAGVSMTILLVSMLAVPMAEWFHKGRRDRPLFPEVRATLKEVDLFGGDGNSTTCSWVEHDQIIDAR